jgi:hypothetical protein
MLCGKQARHSGQSVCSLIKNSRAICSADPSYMLNQSYMLSRPELYAQSELYAQPTPAICSIRAICSTNQSYMLGRPELYAQPGLYVQPELYAQPTRAICSIRTICSIGAICSADPSYMLKPSCMFILCVIIIVGIFMQRSHS